MQVHDARLLRGAAWPTAVVGVVLIVASGLLAGPKGLIGSALGVAVVAIFFSVGLVVIGWASQINPMLMMNVALLTYLVKIIVLGALLFAVRDTTAFDTKAFAWSVFVATLVWITAEIRAFTKLQLPYVDSAQETR